MEFNVADAVASFPNAARKSFGATRETFTFRMRKTQERLLQTIRDSPHVSRLRLRNAIALQSGPGQAPRTMKPLTSMDHYAEGPGEFTWRTVWRM